MTMENRAIDIDRALEEDEQSTMETTKMRPYLDLWDVSKTHEFNILPLLLLQTYILIKSYCLFI
jgi:hypothetical protein